MTEIGRKPVTLEQWLARHAHVIEFAGEYGYWITDADVANFLADQAWAEDHYTVMRSHGCDDSAPECVCGSPLTPHLRSSEKVE